MWIHPPASSSSKMPNTVGPLWRSHIHPHKGPKRTYHAPASSPPEAILRCVSLPPLHGVSMVIGGIPSPRARVASKLAEELCPNATLLRLTRCALESK